MKVKMYPQKTPLCSFWSAVCTFNSPMTPFLPSVALIVNIGLNWDKWGLQNRRNTDLHPKLKQLIRLSAIKELPVVFLGIFPLQQALNRSISAASLHSFSHVWLLRVKVCILESISCCGRRMKKKTKTQVSCPALNLEPLAEANRY